MSALPAGPIEPSHSRLGELDRMQLLSVGERHGFRQDGDAEAASGEAGKRRQIGRLEGDTRPEPCSGARIVQGGAQARSARQADQVAILEGLERDCRSSGQDIVPGDGCDQRLVRDQLKLDAGWRLLRQTDEREVELSDSERLDQFVRVRLRQRDRDSRVVSVEVRQQVDEVYRRAGDHHSHGDPPAYQTAQLVDGEPSARRRAERFPSIDQHCGAGFGEAHRSGRAIEQFLTQLSLELANLGAYTRLRHVKPGCGPGEIGFFRHGDEVLELPEFHKQTC
jgi:hypothetical protein